MKILIDSKISVEENAAKYFERSKKAKKKLDGVAKAISIANERLAKQEEVKIESKAVPSKPQKKEWYERFRWFISSDGTLCVGGKDAATNEEIVKKHADKADLAFHTDMSGSPFVIVKAEGKEISQETKEEAGQFTASYSKAWKQGLGYLEVFFVNPDQLSKTAESGEYVPKGAFMVRGKVNYLQPQIGLAIGKLESGKIMAAPRSAIEAHCEYAWLLHPGSEKTSDVAKELAKKLDCHPDEIIPLIPAGGVKLGVKILGQKHSKS